MIWLFVQRGLEGKFCWTSWIEAIEWNLVRISLWGFKGHKVRMANSATDFSLFIGPEKEKYSYLFCMLKSGYGIDLYCSNLKKSAAVNSFVIVITSVIVIVIVKTLL